MKLLRLILLGIGAFLILSFIFSNFSSDRTQTAMNIPSTLLTDPFLQLPTEDSVKVVWFTEFLGSGHKVVYGDKLDRESMANTIQLSHVGEDIDSKTSEAYPQLTKRNIWRHEAIINELDGDRSIPYKVISQRRVDNKFQTIESKVFNLSASPKSGKPLSILLTSDHQLMPMTAANLQKVGESFDKIDAVFFAGDLVNFPDRASEWFDDNRGGAFFPCLQGRANYILEKNKFKTIYKGAEIIQNAPLFAALGNHEIMGRNRSDTNLKEQFEDTFPLKEAEKKYHQLRQEINPNNDPEIKQTWIKNNSFNTDTYEEIFSLPESDVGGKKYYATSFGDIRLISLYVTNHWRSPNLTPDTKGRYREKATDLDNPDNWGHGQIIFGDIRKDSPQYRWLEEELNSELFQNAKYKIVMFHHPPHTLGDNIVPPYTEPIPKITKEADGKVKSVFYEYPIANDYIIRDLLPLLESAGVNLVFYGHSHLWNRFVSPKGMNFLETSNVGNSYGAYLDKKKRPVPTKDINLDRSNYKEIGDPNGLKPIIPSIAPLLDDKGKPLPYIDSNDITAFSILETGTGTVSSYRFDTRQPNSKIIKFDEFEIDIRR
jgi:hypothetical protein